MPKPKIEIPQGKTFDVKSKGAQLRFRMEFAKRTNSDWQRRYDDAQKFVDSEVIRLSEDYIPLRTGTLRNSGILGTKIGSGEVKWIAPYSRSQYYLPRKVGTQTGSLRGPNWFERMKATWGQFIMRGAKRIAGSRK